MRVLAILGAAALGSSVLAASAEPMLQPVADAPAVPGAPLYAPIPGHMEFSGRLLARIARAPSDTGGLTPAQDGIEPLARHLIEPYIVEYIDDVDIYALAIPAGKDENSFGAELLATGLFEWVRPDWILFPLGSPNDPEYGLQWHLPKIEAPGAWRFTKGAPGIVVAIVDTGVDLTHPDLAPLLVLGCNSYWNSRLDQLHGGRVTDDNGHGTGVAGAGIAVGNNGVGGCGVAWNLGIMPIRATNPASSSGSATSSDIIWGAKWAANHGAKIVNCSWSGVAEPFAESLGQTLRALGTLLVWPMDTLGTATTFDHPDVVVVNGTTPTDGLYGSSNWGPGVDIAAPAEGLWIPARGGGYAWKSGNSYAAPIVAASAGLVWSLDPSLTPLQIEHALEWSASDIGTAGRDDYFGSGRVDPYIAAVNVIMGNLGTPPIVRLPSEISAQDAVNAISQWHIDH